ncbi:MAG: 3-deoxy-manno-octulosonate cytidylyltransferase [Pseudomonadota bacterium]
MENSQSKKKLERKVVAVIPSRYASTRFEGKPLAMILGKPMIQWVCERVGACNILSDVLVATDDRRIADAVLRFGGKAVMTSPENRSGTDRAAEAAATLSLGPEDIVINVQGDQPMIHPGCLEEASDPLFTDPEVVMSTLALAIVEPNEIANPKDVKVVFDRDGYALYFSRSPIPCGRDPGALFTTYKHLGIYAYTRRFLDIFRNLPEGDLERIEKLEQLRALEHGHRIRVVVTPHDSPEVDQPEDIIRIEKLLRKDRSISL